jgi:hypothetical protein
MLEWKKFKEKKMRNFFRIGFVRKFTLVGATFALLWLFVGASLWLMSLGGFASWSDKIRTGWLLASLAIVIWFSYLTPIWLLTPRKLLK